MTSSSSALQIRDDAGALALVEQGERALSAVSDAADAKVEFHKASATNAMIEAAGRAYRVSEETLLASGRYKLRAEARWGELLGRAKIGRPGNNVTAGDVSSDRGRDRMAVKRARQVAAVPKKLREDYLAKVRDPESLRRTRLLRLARETAAQKRRAEPTEPVTRSDDIEIRHGDLRQVLGDLEGVVDAIITDPPYPREFLDEFDALGELAARVLKPDGLLVAMVGQSHLPDYLERLSRHLTYRWTCAYITEGPATRIHGRKIGTKWKPVLVYDRAGERRFLTQDVFRSDGGDKEHHRWGQSESGMAQLVEHFSEPTALVLDPFLGAGTVAVVCRELGRRFIGCDVDGAAIEAARGR